MQRLKTYLLLEFAAPNGNTFGGHICADDNINYYYIRIQEEKNINLLNFQTELITHKCSLVKF